MKLRRYILWLFVTVLTSGCSSEPASMTSDRIVLVYTGGTSSFLDLCGCSEGQLGGLARRATVIRDILGVHPQALVLDAGGLFDGISSIDRLRCKTHLEGMGKMNYHAANLGVDEFRFGGDFARSLMDSSRVALFSSNLIRANGSPFPVARSRILETNGKRVGILGVTAGGGRDGASAMGHESASPDSIIASERLELEDPGDAIRKEISGWPDDVSLVVVLSDLSDQENKKLAESVQGVHVIIGARTERTIEQIGKTLILGSLPRGKAVGKAVLSVGTEGILSSRVEQIRLGEEIAESKDIVKLVDAFYTRVASDPQLREAGTPRFVGFAQEETVIKAVNGYVGGEVCQDCHSSEYSDWTGTHHAKAYNTLLQAQKHFQPDCVTCHTTGFRYPSGFAIMDDALTNVQCETCHGPGRQHVRRPEKKNIRGQVGINVCSNCHNQDQTPDLAERFDEMIEQVNHSHTELERVLDEEFTRSNGEKPRVELFVMAQCPYGIEAEDTLAPVLANFKNQIDFRLHFIAEEAGESRPGSTIRKRTDRESPACQSDALMGSGRFRSLHGDPEIEEGIRQVAIMELYPERYFEYILCRNQEIFKPNWASCAESVGMDPDRIRKVAGGIQGETLFKENIRRANLLGIDASPTLLVNGREIQNVLNVAEFARSICAEHPDLEACASLPACDHDGDCSQSGMVGICIAPGSADAKCEYREPVTFKMVVLNDTACNLCETGHFIRSTLDLFPGVDIRTVEVDSDEGEELVSRYGIDRVPAFIIDNAFERTARFDRFERTVRKVKGAFLPEPIMVPLTQLLHRDQEQGTMKVFLDPKTPFSMGLLSHLLVWLGPVDALDRVDFRFPGSGTQTELRHLCVQDLYSEKLLEYLQCRAKIVLDPSSGQTEVGCLEELEINKSGLERCSSGEAGVELVERAVHYAEQNGVDHRMAPAVVIDNQVVVTGAMVRGVRDIFYSLHPEILERDATYLESRKQ